MCDGKKFCMDLVKSSGEGLKKFCEKFWGIAKKFWGSFQKSSGEVSKKVLGKFPKKFWGSFQKSSGESFVECKKVLVSEILFFERGFKKFLSAPLARPIMLECTTFKGERSSYR